MLRAVVVAGQSCQMDWVDLGIVSASLDTAKAHEAVVDAARSLSVVLVHHGGRWLAFDNACPHQGASLALGDIEDGALVCRQHAWRFSLPDGTCDDQHVCLTSYPVRTDAASGTLQLCVSGAVVPPLLDPCLDEDRPRVPLDDPAATVAAGTWVSTRRRKRSRCSSAAAADSGVLAGLAAASVSSSLATVDTRDTPSSSATVVASQDDAFRATERHWRRSTTLPASPDFGLMLSVPGAQLELPAPLHGLAMPASAWRMHAVKPGLLLLRGVLSPLHQLAWARRAIGVYPEAPFETNLTTNPSRWCDSPRQVWDVQQLGQRRSKLYSLRWSTLGLHYDWSRDCYHVGHASPMPSDLTVLAGYIAQASDISTSFRAEAAIVNYYHQQSRLGGHRDKAEEDTTEPIISVSLGLSAVFLHGTESRDTRPDAVALRSGDVVLMHAAGRRAFHAVPRIMPASLPDDVCAAATQPRAPPGAAELVQYLQDTRININLRYVGDLAHLPPPSPRHSAYNNLTS